MFTRMIYFTQDQQQMRVVCPGCVSALAVSPDGAYCVVSVGEKIHLWQVSHPYIITIKPIYVYI